MTPIPAMIRAYHASGGKLALSEAPDHATLASALWLDLFQPDAATGIRLAGLGLDIPSLEDMEEIELSNRLYRDGEVEYMTVVVPGQNAADEQIAAPVSFILSPTRLVTVRHHAPRPFDTFPPRADKTGLGLSSPDQLFVGLVQ